jgi:hypothetical protein
MRVCLLDGSELPDCFGIENSFRFEDDPVLQREVGDIVVRVREAFCLVVEGDTLGLKVSRYRCFKA